MTTTYGNLSLSELIVYNNTTDTSANLILNPNTGDGNLFMSTGLDVSGNLNVLGQIDINGSLLFTSSTNNSLQQYFTGISLNGNDGGTTNLIFPSNTNGSNSSSPALTPYATSSATATWTAPTGLGITWSITGTGETDLIGYGGGGANTGGVTIWGYNDDNSQDNSTRIADFWPAGSTIYNPLTLSASSGSVNFSMLSPSITGGPNTFLQLTGQGIYFPTNLSQLAFVGDGVTVQHINYNEQGDGNFNMSTGLDINGSLNVTGSGMTTGIYNSSIGSGSLLTNANVYIICNTSNGSYGTIFFNIDLPGSGSVTVVANYCCGYDGAVQTYVVNTLSRGSVPSIISLPTGTNYFSIQGIVYNNYSSTPAVYITIYGSPLTGLSTSATSP